VNSVNYSEVVNELSRRKLKHFAKAVFPEIDLQPFHLSYYSILDRFAHKEIKNLVITKPPQHGKSEGSTRLLPSQILGLYPETNIAIGSYSTTFARKFNRQIQRYINSPEYQQIFPETKLNHHNVVTVDSWLRNADEFQVVNHRGGLLVVGRGGALTGNKVDVMIMDDLYKDSSEGNSPVIRQSVIDWYTSVVQKRLHNDSQQLIVFTRWHEDDLIGFLEENDKVVECFSMEDIDEVLEVDRDTWIKVNFEAIKESDKTEFDNREKGLALWESRHSLKKLLKERKLNEHEFNCMNQGRPEGSAGKLYSKFGTYLALPGVIIKRANYTDTADEGDDYLCSIDYVVDKDGDIYVVDVLFTQEPMEETEKYVPSQLLRNSTRISYIESNNGGRGFARVVENAVGARCEVEWFHQGTNKESRILTNSAQVNKVILFPYDWEVRWPEFARHIKGYKRMFAANKYDDGADVLTGIYEKEVLEEKYELWAN